MKNNYYLLSDNVNQKISWMPWDYSGVPINNICVQNNIWYQTVGSKTNWCSRPNWYNLPGEFDVSKCYESKALSGSPLSTVSMRPFACDPVGHVMAIGWRDE